MSLENVGKDAVLVKKFLFELQKNLDVKQTAKKLNLTQADVERLFKLIGERFFSASVKSKVTKNSPPKKALNCEELIIHVDGASRGNPGTAGAGAILKNIQGGVLKKLRRFLGKATNNVAEYEALILALKESSAMGVKKVYLHADSELVVKQVLGIYKVKNETLKKLHAEVLSLLKNFTEFKIRHVPREQNKEADKLANEAIDGV